MKHIQKILGTMLIALFSISQASAADISINIVDVLDAHTISLSVSDTTDISRGELDGEIKILKDTTITSATKSIDDGFVITMNLEAPLEVNTQYSLLTLFGAEGSIDFETGDALTEIKIDNEAFDSDEQNIDFITITDANTLSISYTSEVSGGEFEYKLLTELEVNSIEKESSSDDRITIHLEDTVEAEKDYILIVITLSGIDGDEITFENSIYDFISSEFIESGSMSESEEVVSDELEEARLSVADKIAARNAKKSENVEEVLPLTEEILPEEEIVEATEISPVEAVEEEEDIELNSAGLMKDTTAVAYTAVATPDTGAETWVLILLTLFINSFYYFTRRKVA